MADLEKRRCTGCSGARINWALPGSEWCRRHDPALAEQRAAWGRTRHVRFSTAVRVDGAPLDVASVPTAARVIDKLLDVADAVEQGELDPMAGRTVVAALKGALDGLQKEYDRALKERLAGKDDVPPALTTSGTSDLEAELEGAH